MTQEEHDKIVLDLNGKWKVALDEAVSAVHNSYAQRIHIHRTIIDRSESRVPAKEWSEGQAKE